MRKAYLLAAVVERLAIMWRRRSGRRRRVIERLCRRPARIVIVDHSAVVQSFAVVRLRGSGNASERHAERQRSHANGDVLLHDFSSNRGFRTAAAATVARSLQLVLSRRGNIDLTP